MPKIFYIASLSMAVLTEGGLKLLVGLIAKCTRLDVPGTCCTGWRTWICYDG